MTLKRALGLWAVALVATAARLPAQSAGEMLQQAIHHYDEVEIEDAVAILRQLVSPSSTLEVSAEQRVQAYKYLGAVFALQSGADKHDSAIANFTAAIQRDPAVSLDAQSFTPAQLAVFTEARNRTFVLAVRPLQVDTLDSTAALTFHCVTSHPALLRAEIRGDSVTLLVLYDGPSDGPRDFTWDGMLPGRNQVVPGRYQLAVTGRSSVVNVTDSATVYFDFQLDHPPLEDSLPDLGPQDLLPEVGADNQQIPANVAENQRRQADRSASNAAVEQRNAEVLRGAKRVVTPLANPAP
jgi:hypothetical protein